MCFQKQHSSQDGTSGFTQQAALGPSHKYHQTVMECDQISLHSCMPHRFTVSCIISCIKCGWRGSVKWCSSFFEGPACCHGSGPHKNVTFWIVSQGFDEHLDFHFTSSKSKKLEELEKEEELREAAGEYDSEPESEDEEMMEIRQLALQIREKKKLKILQSKEKDTRGPRMPRTAKKVSREHAIKVLLMFNNFKGTYKNIK